MTQKSMLMSCEMVNQLIGPGQRLRPTIQGLKLPRIAGRIFGESEERSFTLHIQTSDSLSGDSAHLGRFR